jgi:hypothetical protein
MSKEKDRHDFELQRYNQVTLHGSRAPPTSELRSLLTISSSVCHRARGDCSGASAKTGRLCDLR